MSGVPGDFSYQIGAFQAFVPQFLADTVVIRPYGEYGLALAGYYTQLGGGYWVNVQDWIADQATPSVADLPYLVTQDLKLLPTVKRILIALYWYTSNDTGSTIESAVVPAIGPEVQAWAWAQSTPPPWWQAGPYTRSNAYWLQNNHMVWPTPDDSTLVAAIQYLQGQGYEVGLLPINALITKNYYYANGGEWEIDRSNRVWYDNQALSDFLVSYQSFIQHYIDLCVTNNIRPWLFSVGSGMRDVFTMPDQSQFGKVVEQFQSLIRYCKAQLPNTLTTYFADLDEYFCSYPAGTNPGYLDPLWTTAELDLIGVNWFAPLALDNTEDVPTLRTGTLRDEAYTFYLTTVPWRTSSLLSVTTNTFKTGTPQLPIIPRINGVKNIEDWLVFNHYVPIISGVLAGTTPPNGLCPSQAGDQKVNSHIHGTGTLVSEQPVASPSTGGIAPAPTLHECYLDLHPEEYAFFSLPTQIPDTSVLNFEIDFALNVLTSVTTQNYRVFATSYGLMIDVIQGTITLQLPQSDGSIQSVRLFTLWSGAIELVYTLTQVSISVGGTLDLLVQPVAGTTFVMPSVNQTAWVGNPPAPYQLPAGYTTWNGRIYWISFLIGQGNNISGGQYFFEDAYAGIRTAWDAPSQKEWIALTGYGSIQGSAADPFTRPETVQGPGPPSIDPGYEDAIAANAAIFWNNYRLKDIRGPYGSTFAIDEVYQAVVLYCAITGLEPAGPLHIGAWFFDTRSPGGRLATMPNGWQIFNDAYNGEIDASLNGKAAVRAGGTSLAFTPGETVDQRLGLSITPAPLPPVRSILTEPGVPQP